MPLYYPDTVQKQLVLDTEYRPNPFHHIMGNIDQKTWKRHSTASSSNALG